MQTYYIAPLETVIRELRSSLLHETHWISLDEKVSGKDMVFIMCEFNGKDQIQREETWANIAGVQGVIRDIDDILTNDPLPSAKLNLLKKKLKVKAGDHARAVIKRIAETYKIMKFKRF